VPRFALVLGILSLACSLSVVAFFVGVPLGLLAVILAVSALRAFPAGAGERRSALRGLAVGALGLVAGLGVWFVHVRAIQTAYSIPARPQLQAEFDATFSSATSPLPGAPPRKPTTVASPSAGDLERAKKAAQSTPEAP
jgi:hypothetical protein